jgi:hypothetical protein
VSVTSLPLTSPSEPLRSRLGRTLRRRPAVWVALAVGLVAWAGLVATHRPPHPLPLPKAVAVAKVRTDPGTAKLLAGLHVTRSVVDDIDSRYESVWLFDGNRLLLTAVVSRAGTVAYEAAPVRTGYAYGSNIANDSRVLLLSTLMFILMSAVWPLRRLRNLDVLVTASTVAAVVFLNEGAIARMVLVSYPALLYLAGRCAWRALGPARAPAPSISLYEHLTARLTAAQRLRLLRMTAVTAALVMTMIGLSSLGVIDVGYALMEGATLITHGVLPYGHIPDVVHGDTYPIGSYLLYTPFAAVSPVHSEWDSADFTLVVAVAAVLATGWGLWRALGRDWGARASAALAGPGTADRLAEARRLGPLRAAIAWLTFPPLVIAVSTGTSDVALAGMLLGALVLWRRPTAAGGVLAAGAWFKLAPVGLIPLCLAPLRGRRLLAAAAAIAGVSLVMVSVVVALGGTSGIGAMLHGISYQQTRTSLDSVWSMVGSVPLQQLAQAVTLALIAGAAVRLRRDPGLAGDRVRIAALGGAVLLGLQISSSYWSFMYLAWVLPFLVLSLLAGDDEPSGPSATAAPLR